MHLNKAVVRKDEFQEAMAAHPTNKDLTQKTLPSTLMMLVIQPLATL